MVSPASPVSSASPLNGSAMRIVTPLTSTLTDRVGASATGVFTDVLEVPSTVYGSAPSPAGPDRTSGSSDAAFTVFVTPPG